MAQALNCKFGILEKMSPVCTTLDIAVFRPGLEAGAGGSSSSLSPLLAGSFVIQNAQKR